MITDSELIDRARGAVQGVPDPEMTVVTLGMLGMVQDVRVDDGAVHVDLLPTFSGCPAIDAIRDDVVDAVHEVDEHVEVHVRFLLEPRWTPARITGKGRRALREWGIAPPAQGGAAGSSGPSSARRLPVVESTAESKPAVRDCPYCGATTTRQDSPFGPTPCRALWWCRECQQPFEAFKEL